MKYYTFSKNICQKFLTLKEIANYSLRFVKSFSVIMWPASGCAPKYRYVNFSLFYPVDFVILFVAEFVDLVEGEPL